MSKKMLYTIISITVLMIILTTGILFISINKSKGRMTNSMNTVVKNYIDYINTGEFSNAYEKYMSTITKGYVSLEDYSKLMGIIMGEKNTRMEIAVTEKLKEHKIEIEKDNQVTYIEIPINRNYVKTLGGSSKTLKDEIFIGLIEEKGQYKVYIPEETYYDYMYAYVIGEANECAIEALENKKNESIVVKNVQKIEEYLDFARKIPSSYKKYNESALQIDLITSYKLLAQGDEDGAISIIGESYEKAESKEQKIKVFRVESEIYYSLGNYSKSVDVLKKALEVDPENTDIRRDYRRINSMIIEQIEISLTRGWSQLESAIKQEEKEMDRILSDIAMVEAMAAISVKEDAPDGYYLKGNIEYCLGDYSSSIQSFEKAIELSKSEDTEFKIKTSEILGMARVAQASSDKEKDIKSYQAVFNKDLRSLMFRENEVSGIVDTIK